MGGNQDQAKRKEVKTLFISDLDGTLLMPDVRVSDESAALINRAIAEGALFSCATARTPSTVSHLLRDIHTPLPYIVMTGAAMWDAATRSYSNVITQSPATASAVLQTLRDHRLPAFIYSMNGNMIDIRHIGPLSPLEVTFMSERDSSPFKRFFINPDGNSEIPDPLTDVILFYMMQPSDHVEATYRDVREIKGCNPIFYHDIFGPETGIMEIFSSEASKAHAMLRLKADTGADRVVAFGDNLNDLPLLRAADVAVAVENAVPQVKDAADIVIGPNTADSVAKFILDATLNPEKILS